MSDMKIWLVTGASSGFGRAVTEHVLKLGGKVVATLRQPRVLSDLTTAYSPSQLLVIQADVTNASDVRAAFAKAEAAFGRIDVVLNNAGVLYTTEVETVQETVARDVFEVNFWGAARVSAEAVRFFRQVNRPMGGRLLQVSSQSGVGGLAACGFYSASKFALEGLSESLAAELDPAWNIKVTILEPGAFLTEIFRKNYLTSPQHPAYADPSLLGSQMRKLMVSPEVYDGDVVKAAVVIEKLAHLEDPPMRLPLHRSVVAATREKAKSLAEMADKYESWTNDLYFDN